MKDERDHESPAKKFTHYIIEGITAIGRAAEVRVSTERIAFAYVELFGLERFAQYGPIESFKLLPVEDASIIFRYPGDCN